MRETSMIQADAAGAVMGVLRNRVAHHEPLRDGFSPRPARRPAPKGQLVALQRPRGFLAYIQLARMIDHDLAEGQARAVREAPEHRGNWVYR